MQKLIMERGQATPDPNKKIKKSRFPRGTCFLCGNPFHFEQKQQQPQQKCPQKRNENGRASQGEGGSQGSTWNKQLNQRRLCLRPKAQSAVEMELPGRDRAVIGQLLA